MKRVFTRLMLILIIQMASLSLYAQWGKLNADFNNIVRTVGVHNGSLYAGGLFSNPASRFVRYNGSDWVSVGFPETQGWVSDMVTMGTALIVSHYNSATGEGKLYAYNGTSWGVLASSSSAQFNTLLVFNDELYVGGGFNGITPAFGAPVAASNLVKYDGVAWSAVTDGSGIGPDNIVYDMIDNGMNIIIAGQFNNIGGGKIAGWDGQNWLTYASPTNGPGVNVGEYILSIATYNGELYATGDFSLKGTGAAQRIAKYNGDSETWSTLPFSLQAIGAALHVHNNELYIGFLGANTSTGAYNGIIRWDGTTARKLSQKTSGAWYHGVQGTVRAMTTFGTSLIVAGSFDGSSGDFSYTDGFSLLKWDPCTNIGAASDISGSVQVAPGQTSIEYSVPAIAGVTSYEWNTNNASVTIASGQGTRIASLNVNGAISPVPNSFNLQMTPGNACEVGTAKTLTVSVKYNPVITVSNFTKSYGDAAFSANATSTSLGTLSYSSDNTAVATVNSTTGQITLQGGIGTATITVNQTEATAHWSGTNTFTVQVNKAALTVTAENKSRVYGDVNPALTFTYTGFKNGETVAVLDSQPTASVAASGNSTAAAGTTHAITLSGGSDDHYSFNFVNGSLSITKATLTATADNKTREYGASNPATSITYTGFKNSETASVLDTPPTATIAASANATAGAGTTHNITASGGTDNNYNYTYASGTLTITKASLNATADNKTREYGAGNPALTISYTGFRNSETSAVLDTQPTATLAATANNVAGAGTTHSITLSGGSDNNYSFTFTHGTLSVTKATLIATPENASREYGATNPAVTINYTGFKNGETQAVINTQPTITFAASANSTASAGTTHAITLTGGSDDNYNFNFGTGSLSITKALLIATADAKTREYGATNPATTIGYTGFKNSETASVLDTPPSATIAASATPTAGAGSTHTIHVSGGSDNNYNFSYQTGTLTITKAQLVATAENKTREYGASNPAGTIVYSGFKNSETAAVLDTPPVTSIAATATATANAGTTHVITPTGGVDNNYSFTYQNGTLTVTQATLTVTAMNASRPYSAQNPVPMIGYTGFKNAETETVLDVLPTATIAASANETANAGTVHVIALSGGSDNNYQYQLVNGQLTITKATQLVTFQLQDEFFIGDGTFNLSGTSTSGLPVSYTSSNDAVASISGNVVTMHTTGTVTITASQIGDNNYLPAESVDQSFTITAASRILNISSAGIAFNDVLVGRTEEVSFTLSNTGNSTLAVSNIGSPPGIVVNPVTFTIPASGSVEITVTFSPSEESILTGSLEFFTDATSGITSIPVEATSIIITGEEIPVARQFRIYPNPVNDLLQVKYLGTEVWVRVWIVDGSGRNIRELRMNPSMQQDIYQADVSDLVPGLYLLRGLSDKGVVYQYKMIKL
jgi:hypothetical protein